MSQTAYKRFRLALARSPLMRWRLTGGLTGGLGGGPDAPSAPDEPWFPDPTPVPGLAEAFYLGRLRLAGTERKRAHPPFDAQGFGDDAPLAWHEALHGFGWLRAMRDESTPLAQAHAQALVGDWLTLIGTDLGHPAWRPHIAVRRLDAWLTHRDFLSGADPKPFARALAQHGRALRMMAAGADDATQSEIALVLAIANPRARMSRAGLRALGEDAETILVRGELRDAVRRLALLRRAQAARDVPPGVSQAADGLARRIATVIHASGTLAQFGGTGWLPDGFAALLVGDASGSTDAAYGRLEDGGAVALLDLGQNPLDGAGALELSAPEGPIVTSCGLTERAGDLRDALASAAAHSTLDTGDDAPGNARETRDTSEGLALVVERGAVVHRRKLRFVETGLTGEDEIEGLGAPATLRFHLADTVVARQRGDHAVALALGDASWTFHCRDAAVRLEPTVLFAEAAAEWSEGRGRASQQIVVDVPPSSAGASATQLRWMFVREP